MPLPLRAQSLQHRLDKLLADTLLRDSEVGIAVYDLHADTLLYSYQAEKLYRPASIQKVVTAITALEFLGASHPFSTTLWHTGHITPDSLLEGNLYVVGGFDPLFDKHDMAQFATAVKEMGIKEINGGFIGNISLKDTLQWGSGWCWDDGMPVLSPLLCERADSFPAMFRQALGALGITMRDTLPTYTVTAPDTILTRIACHERTLTQILDRMMKKSDNLHAEAVFYQLAAANEGHSYANAEEGAKMIGKIIRRAGQDPARYRMADGSGVSLYNYLSPTLLTHLLKYAWHHPQIYRPLYESLPIAGVDGTLKHRMKGTAAYRRVRAKTGTVTGVSSLAGYAQAGNGHTLAFVIINQNTLRARAIRAWQDKICHKLCK